MLILIYSFIETFEVLASTLAQRNDTDATGDVVLNRGGDNSAIVIERVPTYTAYESSLA